MAQCVVGELYESITGQLFEIGRQLRQPNGYPFDPEALKRHLQDAIGGRFSEKFEAEPILRLISGDESLVLDPADGTEVIAAAKKVFAYIDSDFKKWSADEPGQATGETPVCVYELVKDATFEQMFASLSSDMRKLCLTQSQIVGFVKKHRQWLRTGGYATFFLFKSRNQFFVANVRFGSDDELSVGVDRFGRPGVWDGEHRNRVVVPQLA